VRSSGTTGNIFVPSVDGSGAVRSAPHDQMTGAGDDADDDWAAPGDWTIGGR
jgi:hypothetical protein